MELLHNHRRTVFVVTLVLIVLATVFTALGIISKLGVKRKATIDVLFAIIAWVISVGLSVSIMIGTQVGLGVPDSGEHK